jgi:uncharacterized membrane protein
VNDVTIARAVHVLAVVLWIGGVGFVTTVLLPALREQRAEDRLALFDSFEGRFSRQAKATTVLAGLSGFYMVLRLDLWDRFPSLAYWWMSAMVGVWGLFTLMLFVAEPLFLHRWLTRRAAVAPEATFRLVHTAHWALLGLSLITLLGAVLGSHGVLLFD